MVKKISLPSLSEPTSRPNAAGVVSARPRLHRRLRVLSEHPFAVPVLTIVGLLVLTGVVLTIANRLAPQTINPNVVVISRDGVRETVSSKEPTVEALLKKLDITVNEGDVVEPAVSTKIQQDDFRINIYRAVPVTILDGEHRDYTFSAATTPRSILRQAGLTVYPEDGIETRPVTDFVANGNIGQEVIVDRSEPVTMHLYGVTLSTRTHADTVRQLLKEKNVKVLAQDIVSPGLDTPLAANAQITVVRNGIAARSVVEDIPMPTQRITDASLSYGVTAVRQQGTPGKRTVIYEINTQNGVEVSRRPLQTTITQEAVAQIVVVGTNISGIKGDMVLAGISPSDYEYVDYIITKESRWNPTAQNASGAYGLCQALPGSKMASAGADWATNPVTQLRWCNGYAVGRYGSWAAAYNFWVAHHYW